MWVGGAAYGYGRVYREYPQAQLQQVPPRPIFQDLQPSVRYVPPWEAAAGLRAALGAVDRIVALMRPEVLPPPPVPPRIMPWEAEKAHWGAVGAQALLVTVVRSGFAQVVPEAPVVSAWRGQLGHWAALSAAAQALYLVRLEVQRVPRIEATPAWAAALLNWPAIAATQQIVVLVQPSVAQVLPASPFLPPWVVAVSHWSAISHADAVVALTRLGTERTSVVEAVPTWKAERDHWAALGRADQALYLVRPSLLQPVEAVPVLHPWVAELVLTAALTDQRLAAYLARGGIERFIPTEAVAFPKLGRWDWATMLRPDGSAVWRQLGLPRFLPLPIPPPVIIVIPEGLIGVTVTNLRTGPIPVPPWVGGVIEETDPKILAPGTLAEAENFVPQRAPRLATRGGSRVMLTLLDDAGSPAEISHVLGLVAKAATGAVVISWSSGTTKHYATAVTSDMAFAGASQALSRTAFPASWNRATPARPVTAVLFEKIYCVDATTTFASRNPLVAIDAATPPAFTSPTFAFVAGGAGASGLFAYCLEEYNNVLFIAGYGDEEAGTGDDPALVRHSYLGKAPDAADGFDKDAYNTIGAKGDRVTAMRKGQGILLVAKPNELYRISGFGRAYPGWQYAVEGVHNSNGFGVENPLALDHAEGLWYGIGKQGPFLSDGYSVTSLVGPRQRTWRGIDKLDQSWVRYHPERRLMLFGVHVTAGAPDATYPWVMLAWDIDRRVWQPNWRLAGNTRFFMVQPIPSTSAVGPGASPSAPNTTAVTVSGFTANWTNGDATAQTEYWEKEGNGAYGLAAVADPGVATLARSSRTDHTTYTWKVRHRKNGVYSGFTADTLAQTLIGTPSIGNLGCVGIGGLVNLRATTLAHGTTTLTWQKSPAGAGTWSTIETDVGDTIGTQHDRAESTVGPQDFRAKSSDAAWPTVDSAFATLNGVDC